MENIPQINTDKSIEEQNPLKVKFSISTKEISEIIKDKKIIEILDEIKSSYPFTMLGRGKVQAEINKLDEIFWIKNEDGKIILVNQAYSKILGLKPSQIEGRYEKEFLPRYLMELFESFSQFVKSTSNIIIKEGIPFPLSSNIEESRIIEFPLSDLDNKVTAIIGLSQKKEPEIADNSIVPSVMEDVQIPFLLMDINAAITFKTRLICKLFPELYSNILPGLWEDEVRQFIRDNKDENIITKLDDNNFVFHLRKLYNNQSELESISLFLDKSTNYNNLDKGRMYEIIMQTSPEPMFIYDIDNLRFLEVNKAALDLYGFTKNEFLQMDLTDLYAPEDIQTLLDTSDSRNKEGVFTGPWRHKKKNGKTILVELSKTYFEYKNKKVHFNIIRDVTRQINQEKDVQLFNSTFNNVSDLIIITDSDGFIVNVNNSVSDILGFKKEEIKDRPFITMVSDAQRADISSTIFNPNLKKQVNLETELKKADGSLVQVELNAAPVINSLNVLTNYNLIAKLSLRQELTPKKVSKQKSPAVSKSDALDPAILSSIFHEILTPMNVIIGFVQELVETISNPTDEQKEAADIIDQNRVLLVQTMDNVMEFSHIEQNRVKIKAERFAFTEILDNIQINTKKLADSNSIEFLFGKISSSLFVETDKSRLENLLIMLVSVAMRITKEKRIYVSAYQYDDNNFVTLLKDNRKSISPGLLTVLKNIYENPIDAVTKDYGSSKLMLNLSKKLLQLLSGKVQVIEKAGEISEFGFIFPLKYNETVEEPVQIKKAAEPVKEKQKPTVESSAEFEEIKPVIVKEEKQKVPVTVTEEAPILPVKIKEEKISIPKDMPVEEKAAQIPIEVKRTEPGAAQKVKAEPEEIKEIKLPSEKIIPEVKKQAIKEEQIPDNGTPAIDLSTLSCLYVEDQVDSQILFKVQLKELKKVDNAVGFETALPKLQQNKYDFIVMDINLQGEYNGLDALRIIRKLPGYEKSKIIAVTAYVLPGDKEKFIAAGFNDFISKPLLREKVIDSIQKIFNQ